MASPIAVILNPSSGSVDDAAALIECIKAGLPEATLFTGNAPGAARDEARVAVEQGFTTIVAAGGDGTLNEVLNGILPRPATPLTLGLLPLGTGNDFARSLGISTELDSALNTLRVGSSRSLDVVRVSSSGGQIHHYLNMSAGGFSGSVSEKTTDEIKATWGALSYLRGMLSALPELSPYQCQAEFDGEPPIELSVINVVLANGRFVASGIPIAPRAELSDGLLDFVAVRESTLARLAILAPQILGGQHLEHENIFFRRAQRVTLRATPAMSFNADGEILGDTPFTFEIQPSAIRFLCPPTAT